MPLLDSELDALLEYTDGAPYVYEPAHADNAADALIEILRKPRTVAILRESVEPLQRTENAIWDLLAKLFDIDAAGGVHLDRIGRIVDLARRDAWNDVTYRRRIRARILQHRSRGRVEELLGIALLMTGLTGTGVLEIREHLGPACMDLIVRVVIDSLDVIDLQVGLGVSKAGGASLQLLVAQDVADMDDVLVAGDAGGSVAGGVVGDEGGAVTGEGLFGAVVAARP